MILDKVCNATIEVQVRERGQVGVKTIFKGKSHGQGQDGGAKYGRDKGMLEVQDNNQANFDVQ